MGAKVRNIVVEIVGNSIMMSMGLIVGYVIKNLFV